MASMVSTDIAHLAMVLISRYQQLEGGVQIEVTDVSDTGHIGRAVIWRACVTVRVGLKPAM